MPGQQGGRVDREQAGHHEAAALHSQRPDGREGDGDDPQGDSPVHTGILAGHTPRTGPLFQRRPAGGDTLGYRHGATIAHGQAVRSNSAAERGPAGSRCAWTTIRLRMKTVARRVTTSVSAMRTNAATHASLVVMWWVTLKRATSSAP